MVSASSGNMYLHIVMALLIYHLSSVSNLQLILGNLLLLLGLMWVRGLGHQVLMPRPWVPSPWPWVSSLGSQVLVNITVDRSFNLGWHSIKGGTITSLALEFC